MHKYATSPELMHAMRRQILLSDLLNLYMTSCEINNTTIPKRQSIKKEAVAILKPCRYLNLSWHARLALCTLYAASALSNSSSG